MNALNKLEAEIKEYARNNYESGYDAIVECWSLDDYADWIKDYEVKTLSQFIKSYKFMIDYRNEMESTEF